MTTKRNTRGTRKGAPGPPHMNTMDTRKMSDLHWSVAPRVAGPADHGASAKPRTAENSWPHVSSTEACANPACGLEPNDPGSTPRGAGLGGRLLKPILGWTRFLDRKDVFFVVMKTRVLHQRWVAQLLRLGLSVAFVRSGRGLVTVAILAQGTSWADAATQAFLGQCLNPPLGVARTFLSTFLSRFLFTFLYVPSRSFTFL